MGFFDSKKKKIIQTWATIDVRLPLKAKIQILAGKLDTSEMTAGAYVKYAGLHVDEKEFTEAMKSFQKEVARED